MACSKNRRIRVGKAGEDIAAGFLIKAGHTILERNWRSGHLEIDLIARYVERMLSAGEKAAG